MPKDQSLFEQLSSGIADAVADIREKVVEEPWFGRVVTERGDSMDASPQWPEARQAEPRPEGLNGEILGPETQPMHARESAGRLEHGTILDAEPMNKEPSAHWPEARQALTYSPEQEREPGQQKDVDIER